MSGTVHCREPSACSEAERWAFSRLVRQGFPAARDLDRRVRAARWLGFHYAPGDALAGVAALKVPSARYRRTMFRRAASPVSPAGCELELGWVFVAPGHRKHGIAAGLCRLLLERVPAAAVFATTRPTNQSMITILRGLGFARVGQHFPRRGEQLALFVRLPGRDLDASDG